MAYCYNGMDDLSAGELFFWIMVDKAQEHLGVEDLAAMFAVIAGQPILKTRGKFAGATKGTSVASVVARRTLNYDLKRRILPTITNQSIRQLRIIFTRNIGTFVGRTVPVVGWVILAYDVAAITAATVSEYNRRVDAGDRCAA
ncbi:MAG: hypothetical protein AAFR17_02445 [Pseudomonadota bacterium]